MPPLQQRAASPTLSRRKRGKRRGGSAAAAAAAAGGGGTFAAQKLGSKRSRPGSAQPQQSQHSLALYGSDAATGTCSSSISSRCSGGGAAVLFGQPQRPAAAAFAKVDVTAYPSRILLWAPPPQASPAFLPHHPQPTPAAEAARAAKAAGALLEPTIARHPGYISTRSFAALVFDTTTTTTTAATTAATTALTPSHSISDSSAASDYAPRRSVTAGTCMSS